MFYDVSYLNFYFLSIFSSHADLVKRQLDSRLAVLTSQQNPVSQVTTRNLTAGIAPDEDIGQLENRQNIAGQNYGYTSGWSDQNVGYRSSYVNQSFDQTEQLNLNVPSWSDSPGTSVVNQHNGDTLSQFMMSNSTRQDSSLIL